MAGFDNDVVYASNVDFTGGSPVIGKVTTDGQLLVGSTASPNIRVGTITSPDLSITIGYSTPNITLQVAGGGSGIATINGDSGSITGSSVTIFSNNATVLCGSSVTFTNSGTVSTLHVSDGIDNTIIGRVAGNLTISGTANCGYGVDSLGALSSGASNTCYGVSSGSALATGNRNCIFGRSAKELVAGGNDNVIIGYNAARSSSASDNVAIGQQSLLAGSTATQNVGCGSLTLANLDTGMRNTAIGYNAGGALIGAEANNIYIGYNVIGTAGDNNKTIIGNTSTTTCFIKGISGVTVAASSPVLIDANGQMGTILSSERYKTDIKDLNEENVLKLRPVSFYYKEGDDHELKVGLIAEEVEKIIPNLVIRNMDGSCESVKYHELCTYLLLEIKRLNKRLCVLENKS